MPRRSAGWQVAFLDLLFNLVVILTLMVHPPTKQANAKPVADFTLYVVWDVGRDTDVDVYIRGPDGKVCWFQRQNIGYVSIDRDDVGSHNDSGPLNQEIVGFRQPPDGHYWISIHTYNERAQGPGKVAFELDDAQGRRLWSAQLPIPANHDETPVIEFEFKDGDFVRYYPSQEMIRRTMFGDRR